jgi:hypothetical protein
VRQRHKATRKASEKVRALTTIATAPTNLRLIVNGADVSQTTQLTFLTQPRGDETDHVEQINDIDSSTVEFDDIDESSIFVDCDLSSSCSSPSPFPQKSEEPVKPLKGCKDFKYNDIDMSSIPNTFDFEAPAFRRVGLPTLPPVDLAIMAADLLPPRATSAQPVDCNPFARDFTSEGLFNSTQEVSIANLRAFAHGALYRVGN